MDGRRRFMRSLSAAEPGFAPAGTGRSWISRDRRPVRTSSMPRAGATVPRARGRRRAAFVGRVLARLSGPLPELFLAVGLLLATGAYGVALGGHYAAFVAAYGEPADIVARALGFTISTVTITGADGIGESSILEICGISPRSSLLLLDAAKVRQRLEAVPLVKQASVAKLYPDRLQVSIVERRPEALWQKDGRVMAVAADGTVLGPYDDLALKVLPHVVGAGANERVAEYLGLIGEAGDLRERIRAGILVSGRRWTLKMTNGIEVHLPETDARAAIANLVELQRSSRILDKDVLALDFRQPGRVAVRLGAEAAAAHAEAAAQKTKSKGGQT